MEHRIVIEDVKTSGDADRFRVDVTLHYKGKIARSTLEGPATKSIDIIAQATLNTVQQYFENYVFSLYRVHIIKVNSHEIVVVLVNIGEKEERVALKSKQAGIALGRDDLHLDIAKATLNALNRVLGKF
jgi:hypothetical protein